MGVALRNGFDGDRLWRWRKVDILFVVGIATILWGAYNFQPAIIVAGGGVLVIPLTQRLDKP